MTKNNRTLARMTSTVKALLTALVMALAAGSVQAQGPRTLKLYFVDVEGGQATLVVLPGGQSLLIDAGFASTGTFGAKPGDPAQARDAQRILAAARDAGVSRIDFLLVTHFHADHMGGVPELAQLLPIDTFIDHGSVVPEAERTVRGTLDAFEAYAAVRARGRHLEPKPGDRLPLQGVTATVVSAAGEIVRAPLPGASGANAGCDATAPPAQEPNENPRSTGVLIEFGKFRFLDLGDLSGAPLRGLVCPEDRIGPVDAYLVPHHANADASAPAILTAFRPRVAVLNNGRRKGGAAQTLATLHQADGLEDVWQIDRSLATGAENFPDERIANLGNETSHWIAIDAHEDGSFAVRNARTGQVRQYAPR
jgi:beta-lactamase superfamily II metal-dependent hydrolase